LKKSFIIPALLVIALAVGGLWLLVVSGDTPAETGSNSSVSVNESITENTNDIANPTVPAEESVVETTEVTQAPTTQQTPPAPTPAPTPIERYVTLASFNADASLYNSQKKVYFFHAPWCPICKSIDEDISSDTSQIPSGTTFIKTDYDSNTSLRQKYGVTYQYTFVQVDNNGNELKQWSATNLDKAIAGIQ
jgi:thiol-disulfide isomerase/thioredoxin